jgi:hypothetical protein
MGSIIPDAFTAFAFVKANGLAAADVEKFEDQAWGDRGTFRAAALHGLSLTLRRIFPGLDHHRGFALALWHWEANQKSDSSQA